MVIKLKNEHKFIENENNFNKIICDLVDQENKYIITITSGPAKTEERFRESILRSLFLGQKGSYNILGVKVSFGLESNCAHFGKLARLRSVIFREYLHVFVHEMSHALTHRLLYQRESTIGIFDICEGITNSRNLPSLFLKWKDVMVSVAGPMGGIGVSFFELFAAVSLNNYLLLPICLVLGLGSVFHISLELKSAFTSCLNKDKNDFGCIANHGNAYLAFASALVVGEVVLCIFATIQFAA